MLPQKEKFDLLKFCSIINSMEADKFRHREEKATVGDLIRRLSLVAGVALPLVIATATDWNFSWATPQLARVVSKEIPERGRIIMSLRLPVNDRYPLWLQVEALGKCSPESERDSRGFVLGLDDRGEPFAVQFGHPPLPSPFYRQIYCQNNP